MAVTQNAAVKHYLVTLLTSLSDSDKLALSSYLNAGTFSSFTTTTLPSIVNANVGVAGTASFFSRSDHRHQVSTAGPSNVGAVNLTGASASLSRADHIHAHGFHSDPAVHAVAIPSVGGVGGANGFLSAVDKENLDGFVSGGVPTSRQINTTAPLTGGGDLTVDRTLAISPATPASAGSMSAADKTKLNGIATGATNVQMASVAPVDVTRAAAVIGVSPDAARADHKHDITTAAPVSVAAANSEGVATTIARSDHIHAHGLQTADNQHALAVAGVSHGFFDKADKTKLDGITAGATNTPLSSTAPVDVTKAAASAGVAIEAARQDHKHDISTAAAGSLLVGDSSAEGIASSVSRSDHKHAFPAPGAPVAVTRASAAAGTSQNAAREDHKHDISTAAAGTLSIGDTASDGAATSLSRSDHRHAFPAPGAPVNITKAAAAAGTSTNVAREDHKHDISTAAATVIGTSNTEGSASTIARSDHGHNHGNQTVETHHALVVAGVSHGFMSAADKAILDGLASSGAHLTWGADSIAAGADTRYLTPGYYASTTGTAAIGMRVRAGTIKNLRARHNTGNGNGNSVVYTVVKNGTPTTLTCTLATGVIGDASDTNAGHNVTTAAGDLIELTAAKASSIANGSLSITVTAEFA